MIILIRSLLISVLLSCLILVNTVVALESFSGYVIDNNINVRADANTSSPVICTVTKGADIEIISEKYDWYKIVLPKSASLYVKKSLVESVDKKTGRVEKDYVNIRLLPNESSAILGKLRKNEIIAIRDDSADWYKIAPTDSCSGWIHKKFVEKSIAEKPASNVLEVAAKEEYVLLEGVIQPYGKVISRVGTHKLVTKDYNIVLLQGNLYNLNSYTYHKVKITGKPVAALKQKYPVIEIIKMEALD